MKVLKSSSPSDSPAIAKLNRRFTPAAGVESTVAGILSEVRQHGDTALQAMALKYDRVDLGEIGLRVSQEEISAARNRVAPDVLHALTAAHANVSEFARRSLRQDWQMQNAQGAMVGEIFRPFQRVGLYVPGGSAPLVSTVLMTASLAQTAGCEEIVVTTPCGPDGKINADMLVALQLAGATEIYRLGGAQAIGALAYGTETIRPVEKIFGPGNKYVVEAKRQVFGTVSIDLLPGPSEIMVLCDDSANAAYVAADLLAQAEHGHDGEIILVTTSERIVNEVQVEISRQLATLPRAEIIREIIEQGAWIVLAANLQEAVRLCNEYAPEHLSLVVAEEAIVMAGIRTAGAIFLGNYSPVAAGDFVAGPSHTLPTGGAGKSFPGLTVDQFQRRTSIVKLDRAALEKTAPLVEKFGEMEGLQAHGRSATLRLS